MRGFHVLIALIVVLSGCGNSQPATKPVVQTTQPVPASSLAGRWSGSASIVVDWVQQKQLQIRLDIAPDGTVNGTVGDATLVGARLAPSRGQIERALGWGRDFRIHGKLAGDMIKDEQVRRDAVDIVFDQKGEVLTGGLHSSGTEFGGKSSMKLSAGSMTLRRVDE